MKRQCHKTGLYWTPSGPRTAPPVIKRHCHKTGLYWTPSGPCTAPPVIKRQCHKTGLSFTPFMSTHSTTCHKVTCSATRLTFPLLNVCLHAHSTTCHTQTPHVQFPLCHITAPGGQLNRLTCGNGSPESMGALHSALLIEPTYDETGLYVPATLRLSHGNEIARIRSKRDCFLRLRL